MKRFIGLIAATAALGLSGLAGTAAASPPTTPNGYVGACNMLRDPTMLTVAMANDASQGNAGMFHATLLTSGDAYCGLEG